MYTTSTEEQPMFTTDLVNLYNRNNFKTSLYIYIFQDEKCRLMRNLALSMCTGLCTQIPALMTPYYFAILLNYIFFFEYNLLKLINLTKKKQVCSTRHCKYRADF